MGNTQVDRYNASIILFYFLGIMTQVTNNFVINPQLYWRYKFRTIGEPWDPASNTTNEMQNDFTAEFSVVANTAAVIGLGIAIVVGRLFGSITRIFGGLCGFIVGFVVLSISAMINTDTWQKEYLCSVLVLFFVLTCFGSVFLVALFEMAAKFTPNFYAATISGQAVCGIFSSAIQILTLMQNVPASTSGLLYFSVAIVCIVLTTLAFYLTMRNSSFFRYHLEQVKIQEDQKEEITKDIIFMVLRKQLLYSLVMVLVFGATAMVHPSITSTVRSVDAGNGNSWNDKFFVPVVVFFSYNIFDFLGRELAVRIEKPTNGIVLLIGSLMRLAIVPLLLMCNLSSKQHTPVWFHSDALFTMFLLLFAFTSGYATNIVTIAVLKKRGNAPGEAVVTVSLLTLIMLGGNGIASYIGLAILKIL